MPIHRCVSAVAVRAPMLRRQGTASPRARQAFRAIALACLFLCGVMSPLTASAHELRPAIATFDFEGERIVVTMSLNLEAAIAGIGAGHENTSDSPAAPRYNRLRQLEPAALRREFERFVPSFLGDITLEIDEARILASVANVDIPAVGDLDLPRISEVKFTGSAPARPRVMTWRIAPVLGDSVLRIRDPATGEIVGTDYVAAGERSVPLALGGADETSWRAVFLEYVEVGFVHIVPMGLDHILFVIGLFLLSTSLSTLLWQISLFTVAHSVSLALATLGIVSVPSTIVEPLIAASIAYVAIENLFTTRLSRWRPIVIFGFGLLHGLGFAGVLGEIGLSPGYFVTALISFNVGVELGQLAVIASCFLAVGLLMPRPWYRRAVASPASLAIGLVAAYWVVERTGWL